MSRDLPKSRGVVMINEPSPNRKRAIELVVAGALDLGAGAAAGGAGPALGYGPGREVLQEDEAQRPRGRAAGCGGLLTCGLRWCAALANSVHHLLTLPPNGEPLSRVERGGVSDFVSYGIVLSTTWNLAALVIGNLLDLPPDLDIHRSVSAGHLVGGAKPSHGIGTCPCLGSQHPKLHVGAGFWVRVPQAIGQRHAPRHRLHARRVVRAPSDCHAYSKYQCLQHPHFSPYYPTAGPAQSTAIRVRTPPAPMRIWRRLLLSARNPPRAGLFSKTV